MLPLSDLPFAFYVCAALAFGLLIGSFLNVVIYRVPRGESVAFPGSHCGSCGAGVRAYDNIPLLSYALLGGRCRKCRAAISWVYPAVELLTGLLFLAVVVKSGPTLRAAAEMAFVAVMVALVFIDARHKLLPDVITYPSFLAALIASAALGWAEREGSASALAKFVSEDAYLLWEMLGVGAVLLATAVPHFRLIDRLDGALFGKYFDWAEAEDPPATPEESAAEQDAERRRDRVVNVTTAVGVSAALSWALLVFVRSGFGEFSPLAAIAAYERLLAAFLGALVGGGLIWLLRAAYFYTRGAEGMGLGDVKMMAVVGAFLGWRSAVLVLIAGSLLGSIVGLVLARRSSEGLKTALPFGVFLGLAAVAALFFGEPLVEWYVGQFK
jgi:leader peptidase (prepilin peptidase) / N-methyltransferase